MGVDLTLLPFTYDMGASASSHTVLHLCRHRDLLDKIQSLPSFQVPKDFATYLKGGREEFGNLQDTPYGERLKYTTAESLLVLRDHVDVKDNWDNRAAWAYLAELPPDTKIALFWH